MKKLCLLLVLLLSACVKQPIDNVEKVKDTYSTNITDYEFASIPFVEDKIVDNELYSGEEYPILLVDNIYCSYENKELAYGTYVACKSAFNTDTYHMIGDYQQLFNLDNVMQGYAIQEGAFNDYNAEFEISRKTIMDIINASTKVIELPYVYSVKINPGEEWQQNSLSLGIVNGVSINFYVTKTYFILECVGNHARRSLTYFENDQLYDLHLKICKENNPWDYPNEYLREKDKYVY